MPDTKIEHYGILKKVTAVYDRGVDFFAFLAALIITGMVGVLLYEVFMRYVIHRPPAWAWEICECMLLLVTFLGAAWLLRRKGHVSVDIVFSRLGMKTRTVVGILTSFLAMFICFLITYNLYLTHPLIFYIKYIIDFCRSFFYMLKTKPP